MTSLSYDPKEKDYGEIAGNSSTNAMIHLCFEYIRREDAQNFVRMFRQLPDDSDQMMHTFRELVLGAYLSSRGFRARHDHVIDGQTPDWSIVGHDESVIGVVELTNFHVDKATEDKIEAELEAGAAAWVWRDEYKDNIDRLYHCIWHKVQVYRDLVERLRVPYVVAVFGEFTASVDLEEVCLCLFHDKFGLFHVYSELSGVLYFEESSGQYLFSYAHNPDALRAIGLPSGVFPPGGAE